MAQKKHQMIEKAERMQKRQKLDKWEVYREQKIEMVAVYIQILKKKNYTRRIINLAIIQKACALNYAMVLARKAETARLVACINMALKAKRLYNSYKNGFGHNIMVRYKNQIRRLMTFQTQSMIIKYRKKALKMTGVIMFEYLTSLQFENYIKIYSKKIQFIKSWRCQLLESRVLRTQSLIRRLMKEKEFLLEIYTEKTTERAQIIVKMLDELWSIRSKPEINKDTLSRCRD